MVSESELATSEQRVARLLEVQHEQIALIKALTDQHTALIKEHRLIARKSTKIGEKRDDDIEEGRGHGFVLVLLDLNNVSFVDHFIKQKSEGGRLAAEMLKAAILQILEMTGQAHLRVLVRAYGNLEEMSKDANFSKICGSESRSLAPFVSAFSQTMPSFDFVDSGDDDAKTRTKIIGNFRTFLQIPDCKRIFFAGSQNQEYLHLLQELATETDKITILHEGGRLLADTCILTLPLFRILKPKIPRHSTNHEPSSSTSTSTIATKSKTIVKPAKFNKHGTRKIIKSTMSRSEDYYPNHLIAVNASGERVDNSLARVTSADWAVYKALKPSLTICYEHVIFGKCPWEACTFDHQLATPAEARCRLTIKRRFACQYGGPVCRIPFCANGHVCPKGKNCPREKGGCKLSNKAHEIDGRVSSWVPASLEGFRVTKTPILMAKVAKVGSQRSASVSVDEEHCGMDIDDPNTMEYGYESDDSYCEPKSDNGHATSNTVDTTGAGGGLEQETENDDEDGSHPHIEEEEDLLLF